MKNLLVVSTMKSVRSELSKKEIVERYKTKKNTLHVAGK
ncbi:hypothetical protein UABAM_06007 [Candidatus Uabimicrobium amorphum]|uniref:Uncharacterized protein n=1 Tax=Uabimicrobium amorphum TaxID=2596890 RepID=A0A5S9F1W6_UABAM|nr:hypothetical protein UABAM_00392 [Candidatus Uabimicrobium amorphum]BBM82082.1 hypothetical protein UABAM_00425 [Candidatus Uabimicrobium amorphum]BBM83045.1 hypothetical protein UABAM_01395 [Candidatus Uabimicrobium amorphum]BBM86556.1 hypothetical protein UABAM_04942 [Candidatus Uabimicrobium amorphum]BBM87595.1 hypothetical protein UABAM_06007 [Candidatus Uabimicrobium amorphum]